jgi:hypothetical protein
MGGHMRKAHECYDMMIFSSPSSCEPPRVDLADIDTVLKMQFLTTMPDARHAFWSYGVFGHDPNAIPPDRLSILEAVYKLYGHDVMLAVKQYAFFTMH